MADNTRAANLDRPSVLRVAVGYAGYGFYLENEAREQSAGREPNYDLPRMQGIEDGHRLLHLAASSYNISAAYFALINGGAASLMFWAAARAYLRLGRLYGGVMAVCARDTRILHDYGPLLLRASYEGIELPYAAIALAALAREDYREFARPLGRLLESSWQSRL